MALVMVQGAVLVVLGVVRVGRSDSGGFSAGGGGGGGGLGCRTDGLPACQPKAQSFNFLNFFLTSQLRAGGCHICTKHTVIA